MKKNIAIVAGGDSAEFEVSLKTASHIYNNIDLDLYKPYLVYINALDWKADICGDKYPINRHDFSIIIKGEKICFDLVYIAIHGTPGENGIFQGYLDMLRIPYSSCNVLSSALSFNKFACNSFLKSLDFKVAKSILIKSNERDISDSYIVDKLSLPCFVKPNADGSSFGITKVKKIGELQDAITKAFNEGDEVIIEEFIDGLEFTCGLLKTKNENIIFPVTEVLPKNEFFDFEAKYDPSMSEEITPARISDARRNEIQETSSAIYDALKCKGIVRIDYIISNDQLYVLEANTIPGMTSNSFIPKQVEAMGLELKNILTKVIVDSL